MPEHIKIKVEELKIGMFIVDFCGSWLDHPFWRKSFVLDDVKDLDAIRKSKIKECLIDLELSSLDIKDMVRPATDDLQVQINQNKVQIVSTPQLVNNVRSIPFEEEVLRAQKLVSSSKKAMAEIFSEARLGRVVSEGDIESLVSDIAQSTSRNASALVSILKLKSIDDYTYLHSVSVCTLMVALGRMLGFSENDQLIAGKAGLMHDLGKIGIPTDILNKPGKLTAEEYKTIQSHPEIGYNLLRDAGYTNEHVLDVCLHHHEKIDGSGYPKRLKGQEISILSRMGAVCDVYDAITSNRVYKKGWEPSISLKNMAEWKGSFDPQVLQAFVRVLGIYPVGTIVRLQSQRVGIVVGQTESLLKPCIKVFYSEKSGERIPIQTVNMNANNTNDKIVSIASSSEFNFINVIDILLTP